MIADARPETRRIALALEYDGSGHHGWQRLSHGSTIQACLEAALSYVAAAPIETTGSGRTDAGVHAVAQVVHFDAPVERSLRGWLMGANTRLPDDISVIWAGFVPADFHARFTARRRRYRYRILNRPVRPALCARQLSWEYRPLDAVAMHAAAQALVGEHDFSAFRAQSCQSHTSKRRVHELTVRRDGDIVTLEIEANAFLHHMVRNIAGSLQIVGRGERPISWIGELLAAKKRDLAGPTASPNGLTYLGPRYPRGLGLPAWLECDDPL